MKDRRVGVISLFPLFLSVALAIGFYVGYTYNPWDTSDKEKQEVIKLNSVLSYIESNYVDDIDRDAMVEESIQALLENLDPHSSYISAEELKRLNEPLEGRFGGVGIRFLINQDTLVVTNLIEGGPSERAGLLPGDRIIAVDGEDITTGELSNADVQDKLKGSPGSEVNLTVLRLGEGELEFTFLRGSVPFKSVDASVMLDDETGYIRLARFAGPTFSEFYKAARDLKKRGMKKMIFDLRGNGGGYLTAAEEIVDEFLERGKLIVYTEGEHREREERLSERSGSLTDIELVVLIDSRSASASEIVAGALQDNDRGIIMGRRSFGKGLVQQQKEWDDGSAIRLTIARYYTPTGRSIQKPYGDGIDYENDQMERYESGEFYEVDSSLFVDSLKYTTPGGRIVYGGGGIMPDIFVPYDTSYSSMYLTQLLYADAFNQFTFRYMDQNRDKVRGYISPENFDAQFEVSEELVRQLVDYANDHLNISPSAYALDQSRPMIKNRLKAEIARHVFEDNGYFLVRSRMDHDVIEAVKILSGEAKFNP